jgi:hypothetical protein
VVHLAVTRSLAAPVARDPERSPHPAAGQGRDRRDVVAEHGVHRHQPQRVRPSIRGSLLQDQEQAAQAEFGQVR